MNGQQREMRILWQKTDNGGVRIVRVYGTEPVAELPDVVDGLPVTEIGPYCFAKTAHIPEDCFVFCGSDASGSRLGHPVVLSGQAEGEIPADVREICGEFLEELSIPDSVTVIGNLAFYNCTRLRRLELGKNICSVGSDVFMNCRSFHDLTVRCGVGEKSGVRQILSQIAAGLLVTFLGQSGVEAVVLYPEYSESYDEIAPAHLFGRNIEGEGFRARQCFKDGVLDLNRYDMIFPKACAEETSDVLERMVCSRLRYPAELKESAGKLYEAYFKKREREICRRLVREKNSSDIRFFCENGLFTETSVACGIAEAAAMEWAEGVVLLQKIRQEFFRPGAKERYAFDAF